MSMFTGTQVTLNRRIVRSALKRWGKTQRLGDHALAQLTCIKVRRLRAGYGDTPNGRGLAVRELLKEGLAQVKPAEEVPQLNQRRWRPYFILTEQYLHGRSPAWIRAQLNVSERTFFEEQARGLDQLLDYLLVQEEEARSTVPLPSTSLSQTAPLSPEIVIGRDGLLEELVQQIKPGAPVAALYGMPGVGKTTLAAVLAGHDKILDRFPDGVLWVGLGPNPDQSALLRRWVAALKLYIPDELPPSEVARRIHEAIGGRQMLLIIDDGWSIEEILMFKLGGANSTHLLTTRFPPLAHEFAASRVWPVRELNLMEGLTLMGKMAPEAVEAESELVAGVVQATAGLPLALVLIGKQLHKISHIGHGRRLRNLLTSLTQADERLKLQLNLAPPARHPSLEPDQPLSLAAIIALSTERLSPSAQEALRALVIFSAKPNHFSETAARTVSDSSLETLDELVDAGLVEPIGDDRYALHQAIVDFARRQPPPAEAETRLIQFFTAFAVENGRKFGQIDIEYPQVRLALEFAQTGQHFESFWLLHQHLFEYHLTRGLVAQIEPVIKAQESPADPVLESRRQLLLGRIAVTHKEWEAAEAHLKRGLAHLDDGAEVSLRVMLYHALTLMHHRRDTLPEAAEWIEQGVQLSRVGGDLHGELAFEVILGLLAVRQGELAQGAAHYQKAAQRAAELGEAALAMSAEYNLGVIFSRQNDYPTARYHYERAGHFIRELNHAAAYASLLNNLGVVAKDEGDWERAQELYTQALRISRQNNHVNGEILASGNLGTLNMMMGHYEAAGRYAALVVEMSEAHDRPLIAGLGQTVLVRVALCQDQLAQAEQACSAAQTLGQKVEDTYLLAMISRREGEVRWYRGDWPGAKASFETACELMGKLGRRMMLAEMQLALGRTHLMLEEWKALRPLTEEALAVLQDETAGLEDPVQAFLNAHELLNALGEQELAQEMLSKGEIYLAHQAAQISDQKMRQRFLTGPQAHQQLEKLSIGNS